MTIKRNFGILYFDQGLKIYAHFGVIAWDKKNSIRYLYATNEDLIRIIAYFNENKIYHKTATRNGTIYSLDINKKYIIKNLSNFLPIKYTPEDNYNYLLKFICLIARHNINLNRTKSYSSSSLAYNLYKNKFYDKRYKLIFNLYFREDRFLRKAYFGGRTGYLHNNAKQFYFYDINSSYPYIMDTLPMPVGIPTKFYFLEHDKDIFTFSANTFGFLEVTFQPNNITIPILPIRDKKGNLTFPVNGTHKGVYFSEELKLAKSFGYTLEFHSAYLFEKKIIFKDYIKYWYEFKLHSDPDIKTIAKKFLNHLYGSFGLDYENKLVKNARHDPKEKEIEPEKEKKKQKKKVDHTDDDIDDDDDDETFVDYDIDEKTETAKKIKLARNRPRNVSIAAAIASYGRIILYKYIVQFDALYFDTDSLICPEPMPEQYLGTELGQFKAVYKEKIIDFIHIQSKFYALLFESGEEKLVIRGYQAKDIQWDFASLKEKLKLAKEKNTDLVLYLKTGKKLAFKLN